MARSIDMDRVKKAARERAAKARSTQEAQRAGAAPGALDEAITNLLENDPRFRQLVTEAAAHNADAIMRAADIPDRLREHEKNANEVSSRIIHRMEREHDETERALKAEMYQTLDRIKSEMLRTITIELPDMPTIEVDTAHYNFPRLIRKLPLGNHVMLVGPAGTGKGKAAQQAAETLGRTFYSKSCSQGDTPSKWFGYMDGHGKYHTTPFREAYEKGGVMFIDEWDAAKPEISIEINGALADGVASFPDGMVQQHENFVVVAAGNTWGRGSDRQYRGTTVMNAATLDRFQQVFWDYDERLEKAIAPHPEWCNYVQAVRRIVLDHKMQYVVSMRATLMGGKELLAGAPVHEVAQDTVFGKWAQDDIEKLNALMNRSRNGVLEMHKEIAEGMGVQ